MPTADQAELDGPVLDRPARSERRGDEVGEPLRERLLRRTIGVAPLLLTGTEAGLVRGVAVAHRLVVHDAGDAWGEEAAEVGR